jgi:hypothetical protein
VRNRVGALSDLGVGLVLWPIVILVSVTFFNTGALSLFFQAALYGAVIIGAVAAGIIASLTGPTDVGAHWGPQAFALAALGGTYAVATGANLNIFLSDPLGVFTWLYLFMSVSFIIGVVLWVSQAGGGGGA